MRFHFYLRQFNSSTVFDNPAYFSLRRRMRIEHFSHKKCQRVLHDIILLSFGLILFYISTYLLSWTNWYRGGNIFATFFGTTPTLASIRLNTTQRPLFQFVAEGPYLILRGSWYSAWLESGYYSMNWSFGSFSVENKTPLLAYEVFHKIMSRAKVERNKRGLLKSAWHWIGGVIDYQMYWIFWKIQMD